MVTIVVILASFKYERGTVVYTISKKKPKNEPAISRWVEAFRKKIERDRRFDLCAILVDGYPSADYINPQRTNYLVEI